MVIFFNLYLSNFDCVCWKCFILLIFPSLLGTNTVTFLFGFANLFGRIINRLICSFLFQNGWSIIVFLIQDAIYLDQLRIMFFCQRTKSRPCHCNLGWIIMHTSIIIDCLLAAGLFLESYCFALYAFKFGYRLTLKSRSGPSLSFAVEQLAPDIKLGIFHVFFVVLQSAVGQGGLSWVCFKGWWWTWRQAWWQAWEP